MAMEDDEVENGANPGSLAFLGVFFLPAGVTALIFYLLLRKGRLRLSSLFQIFVVFEALMVLLWVGLNVNDKFVAAVSSPTKIGDNWQSLLLPLILFYFALGGFAGLFIVWWEIKQMKANPHRLALEGNWQYKFKFRRGITQVFKRRKNIEGLKLGRFIDEDKAPLGLNEEEDDRVVSRYYSEAATHTLISGASGSGKTITLQSCVGADIHNGVPTIIIDFKSSPEFASKVAAWASENDREFFHFVNGSPMNYDVKHSKGQCFYDPLGDNSPGVKADMLIGLREYDTASEVYKTNMQQLLQVLFAVLHTADRSRANLQLEKEIWYVKKDLGDKKGKQWTVLEESMGGIQMLGEPRALQAFIESDEASRLLKRDPAYAANQVGAKEALLGLGVLRRKIVPALDWESGGFSLIAAALTGDPSTGLFADLVAACVGNPRVYQSASEALEELRGKDTGLSRAFKELQGQIRTIVTSEYGEWIANPGQGRVIDLFELTSKPGSVVLFSLNSDSEPEFANYMGSLILADITNTSAKRRNRQLKNQVSIYVDEFQAVNPASVSGLLEKSRESKMAVTLAQQSFEQIVSSAGNNGEAYLLSILDTCSNFIVHNGMTEDSAERLSKILGKHWVTQYRASNQNQSFFLSFNWRNKRDSVITTAKEEDWVFSPRKFMTLMSPTEGNGFKSTAVVINKSCADPHYAGRQGAVARRVWMIPRDEVLETYYDPTYRLVNHESSSVTTLSDNETVHLAKELSIETDRDLDNSWEPIVAPEYDYLASKRAKEEPEDEGDFDFEYIGEEATEEEDLASYKADLADRPAPTISDSDARLPEVRPASELTLPAIKDDPLAQWGSSVVSPPPRRVRAIKEPEIEDAPLPPLPSSHKGGLPIPPPRPNSSPPATSKANERKARDGGDAEELTLPGL